MIALKIYGIIVAFIGGALIAVGVVSFLTGDNHIIEKGLSLFKE